ncbi:hypothetical protein [Ottowia sp. VDI28]|uniref:hypothetical protein n=1 Tax=Ottowia sp. VDI28 TaxID=3133968 RepID=UPI003C2BEBB1
MSEGINRECSMLWLTIAKQGGWWGVLRLTREWAPTFSLNEVERHLVTLYKGNFLEAQHHQKVGTVYSFTAQCIALMPLKGAVHAPAPLDPPEPGRPSNCYGSLQPALRPGALDHMNHPSLLLGKRTHRAGGASILR